MALALGFDLAGIAPAARVQRDDFLRDWLARGRAGEMHYLGRRSAERLDPGLVLEGVRSIVVVGLVHDRDAQPPRRIARYAGGDDYHDVMIDRLRALESALEAAAGTAVRSRSYVDTGPVLERHHGALAGLGWVGKNTCLIHPRLGSHFFLGVLLCDLGLAPDTPEPDHCGSCRACLDACPTEAFPEPYVLDASRCISYTTIELRDAIPEALREGQGDWVFGCDVCQDVCPWNTRNLRTVPEDRAGLRARLAPRPEWQTPSLAWLLSLDEEAWRAATKGTALRRAKWRGLTRNALVAAGNSRDVSLLPRVREHAESDDPMIAEHARWAEARLELLEDR